MFYNYIRKQLEGGKVKMGLAPWGAEDEEMSIEGEGIVNFIKFFLSKEEKQQLKRILIADAIKTRDSRSTMVTETKEAKELDENKNKKESKSY